MKITRTRRCIAAGAAIHVRALKTKGEHDRVRRRLTAGQKPLGLHTMSWLSIVQPLPDMPLPSPGSTLLYRV